MKKIVFYDGDVKAFINGRKAVLLKFGPSELVLDGVLTKMFSKQDAKRGFEQIYIPNYGLLSLILKLPCGIS